jgi:hypothetical protein
MGYGFGKLTALAAAVAMAWGVQGGPASAQDAPAGGVDVQIRVDDLVETYSPGPNTLTFLLRNVSLGYEITSSGRGVFPARRMTLPRETVDQSIAVKREPRGIIIEEEGGQPMLKFRFSDDKHEVRVRGVFIKSTWEMLTSGRTVTIMVPVERLTILKRVAGQVGKAVTTELRQEYDAVPASFAPLTMRRYRAEADNAIITATRNKLTISYPAMTATYDAPATPRPKAAPTAAGTPQ